MAEKDPKDTITVFKVCYLGDDFASEYAVDKNTYDGLRNLFMDPNVQWVNFVPYASRRPISINKNLVKAVVW